MKTITFSRPQSIWDYDFLKSMSDILTNVELPTTSAANRWKKSEDGESYKLTVDIPGFAKDEIEIKEFDNVLTIKALNDERGNFDYSISLPVDLDKINSRLENGVLYIIGTVAEKNKTKTIKIQ